MGNNYNLSGQEIEDLTKMKSKIVDICDKCSGEGYVVDDKGQDHLCQCMILFKYVKELYLSRIPKDYWALELDALKIKPMYKELIFTYETNLSRALDKGLGFLFLGANGTGKTSLMAEVGKTGVCHGQRVIYFTVENYLTALQSDPLLIQRIGESKMLLIDELDKAYFKEGSVYGPKKMEDLVRTSLRDNKVIVMATNMDEDGLGDMFGESMISMLRRHLKFVPVVGNDFSSHLQDGWMSELKVDYDFYQKSIVDASNERMEHCANEY